MSPDEVIARLEAAGSTLIALRLSYGPTGHRSAMPEPVREAAMDEALGWVGLIPADRYVLRRIVHARAIVSPTNQRHLFTWSAIARLIGADRRAVQRWHAQGIALIAARINLPQRPKSGPHPRYQAGVAHAAAG
jgi:hypothetical protein